MNGMRWVWIGMYGVLGVTALWDVWKREVPAVSLVLSGLLSAAVCFLQGEAFSAYEAALSLLPGLMLLLLAWSTRGAMGYGDGLLTLCIGPAFGWMTLLFGLFLAFLGSAVVSLVLLVRKKAGRKSTLPFLPFLALGMGVAYAL